MHKLQADRYYVAAGDVRIGMSTAAPTHRLPARRTRCSSRTGLPGCSTFRRASGTPTRTGARRVNFPTRAYDPDEPDKFHIDLDAGGIPFDWSLRDY